jgi:RNA polymerase sigma-70 factor (ECF subfamily)
MNTYNEIKIRFIKLTEPWWQRLYNVALRHTGQAAIAEDWIQETLLRAWKDFGQLQENIAIYAWLLKILDRVIADDQRRNARRNQIAPVITVDDQNLAAHPCAAPGPFQQTLTRNNQQQLQQAIAQLPDEFRAVVLLRDVEGLSYSEVSQILNIAKGTVMSRLSRGRRLLASSILKADHGSNRQKMDSNINHFKAKLRDE